MFLDDFEILYELTSKLAYVIVIVIFHPKIMNQYLSNISLDILFKIYYND